MGVIASKTPANAFPLLHSSLDILTRVINEPDSRSNDDKVDSTENCIGALGKLIYHHFNNSSINNDTVKFFLSLLPLISDGEEA